MKKQSMPPSPEHDFGLEVLCQDPVPGQWARKVLRPKHSFSDAEMSSGKGEDHEQE